MAQGPRAAQPLHLEQDEAEEEEEHVDDLVDDEAAGKGHHDELGGADEEPELGEEVPHHLPQLVQHVPHLAGVCGGTEGLQELAGGTPVSAAGCSAWRGAGEPSPVSLVDTSSSGVAGALLVSSFSVTKRRSSIQKVRVNRSCGDGR